MAENPKLHKFAISGHPISELDSELMDDTKRAFAKFLKVDENAVRMSNEVIIMDSRNPDIMKVKNVDVPDSFSDTQIQVRTSERNGKIEVGKYVVSGSNFSMLAYSIASGGFAGWGDKVPQFASEALKAIEGGGNPLFRSIRTQPLKSRG
ncbi:MAG: hypothetical protein KGH58_04310 [Candidatus Micrarchaeota archaeon]|nr:hypothetical protein [Candidatus Micrarchaeota archaeon]